MDHLPVPPLAQTLQRYLVAVHPLLSPQQRQATQDAVARTLEGEGPACQTELEAFAEAENAQGRSWLSAAWLRGYLAVRTPLPLTSNVGFQIRVPAGPTTWPPGPVRSGSARAAAVIHRLAAVHLAWLRGELPPEQTPRGQAVCGVQREVLAGGLRHPAADVDDVRAGSQDPARREIGLLIDDRFHTLRVSDEQGRPLPAEVLQRCVDSALQQTPPSEPTPAPGFTALSYLGSETASAYLDRLLQDPANRHLYDRLTQTLFVVNRLRTPADEQDQLIRTAFMPGQAWAYKPITYQVSLADDYVGMHLEHSRVDAATLKAVLAHAQQEHPVIEPGDADDEGALLERWRWRLPADLADDLTRELAAYRAAAERLRLDTVRVPRPVPAGLPFRVSDDALCQWVMLYAQLATHGRVRSTYEAVDLRHYQAGRTECLRSVTPEAVALVQALVCGQASAAHLHEALAAHRDGIKACKTGQGIDRHLTGLALMATATDRSLPVARDAGWSRLKTDFLSTSSLGDHEQILGVAFAPTSEGGIGINYTPLPEHYEFLVSSHRRQTADIETFIAQLAEGSSALAALLAAMIEVAGAPT